MNKYKKYFIMMASPPQYDACNIKVKGSTITGGHAKSSLHGKVHLFCSLYTNLITKLVLFACQEVERETRTHAC